MSTARIGPIENIAPPPDVPGPPRTELRRAMDEMEAGQSRLFTPPQGAALRRFYVQVGNTARRAWGMGGARIRQEGQAVRVWRLR